MKAISFSLESTISQVSVTCLELTTSLEGEMLSQTTKGCWHAGKDKVAQHTRERKGTGLAQPSCELMVEKEF